MRKVYIVARCRRESAFLLVKKNCRVNCSTHDGVRWRPSRNHGKNTVSLESLRAVVFYGVFLKNPLRSPIRVRYVRIVLVLIVYCYNRPPPLCHTQPLRCLLKKIFLKILALE